MTVLRDRLPHASRAARAGGSALCALLAGCTAFTPVQPAAVPDAQSVRVRLTAEGTRRVEPAFGPYIVALDAVRDGGGADTLVFRVSRTFHQAGVDERRSGDVVRLARSDIEAVERRQLSRGRTLGVLAAIVAGALLLPGLFGADVGGGQSGGPTPTPP
jgi:hypothetical protein